MGKDQAKPKTTLESFFGASVVTQPKKVEAVAVMERCSTPSCRKILGAKEPKYELKIKGQIKPYCRECAKRILGPQEEAESI